MGFVNSSGAKMHNFTSQGRMQENMLPGKLKKKCINLLIFCIAPLESGVLHQALQDKSSYYGSRLV